ncbi:ficolin-2-like [Watersipora subatra]|uniref:ficolin-2-like n=1 Tax=Watersipora subatra TaxID=2589382 RepID=UPI00355BCC4C
MIALKRAEVVGETTGTQKSILTGSPRGSLSSPIGSTDGRMVLESDFMLGASMKLHLISPNFILLLITIFSTPVAMDELYDIIRDVSQDLITNHSSFETADCQDAFDNGERNSGAVYTLYTDPESAPVLAVCQFDDQSGWTLIQRRLDGTIDFNRGWDEYARGFGNIQGEYWIGLENIHHLTKKNQKLSIFLEDHEGQSRTANYSLFQIENKESNYQLLVSGYSGDAEDSLSYHHELKFSTFDYDNDGSPGSCAFTYQGDHNKIIQLVV